MVALAPSFAEPVSLSAPGAVRAWLWVVAALVFAMVVVGGATRLTESGLSITEWKLVTGVVPPLGLDAWQAEFDKYKQIPQFAKLFPDMTLAQFRGIYFWEWGHRLLGRVVGLVFALPLAWFWWRGRLTPRLKAQLLALLLLGGLQGAVGWWMVKSGLANRVEVSQYRLALHLLLASLSFAALAWVATGLRPSATASSLPWRCRAAGFCLLCLTLTQIGLGALVAGLRAGLSYNTWPLMDGHFIPPLEDLTRQSPAWSNLFENVTTVQFDHRMVAYALLALASWHAFDTARRAPHSAAARRAMTAAGLVVLQATLGIATLLLAAPLHVALAHQAVAMLVLGMVAVHARRLAEM